MEEEPTESPEEWTEGGSSEEDGETVPQEETPVPQEGSDATVNDPVVSEPEPEGGDVGITSEDVTQ